MASDVVLMVVFAKSSALMASTIPDDNCFVWMAAATVFSLAFLRFTISAPSILEVLDITGFKKNSLSNSIITESSSTSYPSASTNTFLAPTGTANENLPSTSVTPESCDPVTNSLAPTSALPVSDITLPTNKPLPVCAETVPNPAAINMKTIALRMEFTILQNSRISVTPKLTELYQALTYG